MTGPTYLTILRAILSIVFMPFIFMSYDWARITALVIFIIAAITDRIDGKWARKANLVTDLGTFLDPVADKMLVNLTFLALVQLGLVPLWVFAIILVRDFAVDGIRMMAAGHKVTMPAYFLGKLKTTIQMLALILLQLTLIINSNILIIIADIFLYAALALTIISGLQIAIKGWKLSSK